MGLSFGWRANEVRESIWKDDDAFPRAPSGDPDIPVGALDAWKEDGDASHLQPYVKNGTASRITIRTLTPDETRMAQAFFVDVSSPMEAWARSMLLCFRLGVDFPDAPEKFVDASGVSHLRVVKERGVRMLSGAFVAHLDRSYPDMVAFYGNLIYRAAFPTDAEKKASLPPSTPTPSSVAVSTADTTAPSPSAGAATGAP